MNFAVPGGVASIAAKEARYEGSEISEAVGSRPKHDDGYGERDDVLLKGQVSIYCYEYVEPRRRECEQLSILERCPSHLTRGLDLMGSKLAAEAPVDTLVEQHPHETVSISRSLLPPGRQ